jgi:hypothetical protein
VRDVIQDILMSRIEVKNGGGGWMAECLRFLTSDHWSDIMTILTSNIKVSIYFLKCGGFNGQFAINVIISHITRIIYYYIFIFVNVFAVHS